MNIADQRKKRHGNRFPSVAAIRNRVDIDHPDHIYPAMTGALTSAYKTAVDEYETLKELATALLEGEEDAKAHLRYFLKIQDGIAELYANADRIAG